MSPQPPRAGAGVPGPPPRTHAAAAERSARWVPEPAKSSGDGARSPYERDRARVLHCAAFRRLAAKTQVVEPWRPDVPRTRLTHSLEVAQIGRELGEALGCDPDVVETACLAHDIGHPPFGHHGEDVLDELAGSCGGFEGNAQTLRVLTRLEVKVLAPGGTSAGLNLTRATLDATTKYPWPRQQGSRKFGVYADDLAVFHWVRVGAPDGRRCLEAQVMDWADDVAYSVHDVEDAVASGLLDLDTFRQPEVREGVVELAATQSGLAPADLREGFAGLVAQPWWPGRHDGSLASWVALKRMTSELIARFTGAAEQATRAVAGPGPLSGYAADLAVPAPVRVECVLLKAVAVRYVMQLQDAVEVRRAQRRVVEDLVSVLSERAPGALDPVLRAPWRDAADDAGRLRVVVDQVASLTDTGALGWHRRLTGASVSPAGGAAAG